VFVVLLRAAMRLPKCCSTYALSRSYACQSVESSGDPPATAGSYVCMLMALLLFVGTLPAPAVSAQDSGEALAAYADAANFQTGGAIDLAIQAWETFLKEYPQHELVPQAWHYLGVCYMQRESPDLAAASKAFGRAVKFDEYEMREESLANRGWCLYATAGDGPQRDAKSLQAAIDTFGMLRDEFPSSQFLDRALFFSGEAAFAMEKPEQAIDFYNQLLSLPDVEKSDLRCQALYARGIAQETAGEVDDAYTSYRQLVDTCKESDLLADVFLRMGDMSVSKGQSKRALRMFEKTLETAEQEDDRAYALLRQGYVLAQLDRPREAAAKYDQLRKNFSDSPYAAAALLAAAQTAYRGGDFDTAAERFREVIREGDPAAATEATHWLARIEISRSQFRDAKAVIRAQLDRGAKGPFAAELQLDLAEVLAANSETEAAALDLFLRVYREAPDSPLAPRALYNAAFSALQLDQHQQAFDLSRDFLNRFPRDQLRLDVKFIAAESRLAAGAADEAADRYLELVSETPADAVQRSVWVLRCAAAMSGAGLHDRVTEWLQQQLDSLAQPDQRGQALLLIGQAHLAAGRTEPAEQALQQSLQSQPQGPIADRARYQLAGLASRSQDFEQASRWYQQVIDSAQATQLVPHARYGKAAALIQIGKHEDAIDTLNELLESVDQQSLRRDALLARGISKRHQGDFEAARDDLQAALDLEPTGTSLGHALYELALIDQKDQRPADAAKKLQRLVDEVPDYPAMDKVLYELGWSLQEQQSDGDAVGPFRRLVTQYPSSPLSHDAAYFVGQHHYAQGDWQQAAEQYKIAAASGDPSLSEKALYRRGWSLYKLDKFDAGETAFAEQAKQHPSGPLAFDALAMVAECRFKRGEYQDALQAFEVARERIRRDDETSSSIRDESSRQVRELVLLHGGQSAAQLGNWNAAIKWHEEHRSRFPSSNYLPQVFYETGFAYHQRDDLENALKFYRQVAENYRNEIAARARFMIGEIHFSNRQLDKAIPEFQRVMFGFGAEQAPDEIKNWQAKSGFEAARSSELLIASAQSPQAKTKAARLAKKFYNYVIEKHPQHELAAKARLQLEALAE